MTTLQNRVSQLIGDAAFLALCESGVSEVEIPEQAAVLVAQMDNLAMNFSRPANTDAKLREKLGKGKIEGEKVTLIFKGNRSVTMTKPEWATLIEKYAEPRQIANKRLA